VRPGDRLTGTSEVLEVRASKRRPEMGVVQFRHTVENANGITVLEMLNPLMFGRRKDAGS
jgi:acyl dehydratase